MGSTRKKKYCPNKLTKKSFIRGRKTHGCFLSGGSAVRRLMKWNSLGIDETVKLTDEFVHNFVDFLAESGIVVREHTPLEDVDT